MSIEVTWDCPEKNILAFRFADPWNWLQMRRKVRYAIALSDKVGHSLGVFFDLSNSQQFPDKPGDHVSGLLPYLPPNWDTIVVISADPDTAQIFAPIYETYRAEGLRLLLVQTRQQAQLLLEHEHHMKMQGCRSVS